MKNILLVISMFLYFSCAENLLQEHPKAIATETFYNTRAELESAVNAIYYNVGVSQLVNQINLMEPLSDYGYGKGSLSYLNDYIGYSPANVTNIGYLWQAYYLLIRNANLVILNAPKGTSTTETEKANFIAEARFIRAFSYFNLVRLWGPIPLRTELNMNEIDVARSSELEVYNFILEDLKYSEAYCPDEPRVLGTPSKLVVKTVLADVYLTRKMYELAKEKANEVIQSNEFSLVPVSEVADFQNIYGADLITSSEEIFYQKYTRDYGNNILTFMHYPGDGYKPYGAAYFAHYTYGDNLFIREWDDNDLRKQNNIYKRDIALGDDTYLYRKYIDPNGYNNAPNDWPFYRYPEVLLIYAEADNRINKGPTDEAMSYLNMVRRRGYGYSATESSPIDFIPSDYNEEQFFELVLREKAYETFFEAKRWFDLKRTGKTAEVIKRTFNIDINQFMLLWPIPPGELSYNKLMDQNPGY